MKVSIPFKTFFKEPLLAGVKVCTARTKYMGQSGDRFEAFGAVFEIFSVERVLLRQVADVWKDEGCRSREHFIEVWTGIHPVAGFDPEMLVILHRFRKLS